jgi:hypothetical protein
MKPCGDCSRVCGVEIEEVVIIPQRSLQRIESAL